MSLGSPPGGTSTGVALPAGVVEDLVDALAERYVRLASHVLIQIDQILILDD